MLYKKLTELDTLPMHMPGHKRNTALAPYLSALRADIDITEIDGFDNLHSAEGVLEQINRQASALWGSKRSYMLVNGSTCGLLSAIRALTRRNDKVIISRNAHKSVFHAIELCGLNPVFVLPPIIEGADTFGSLSPDTVTQALEDNPDARLVIVTSPTYEGVISDIAGICAAAHARNAAVLVDEAHGAHLALSDGFGGSAVSAGADIVVQSLHKTLPSLTQTAILHVCTDNVDCERLAHQLAVFETSSPSYLLMASIGECVRLLSEKSQIIDRWLGALDLFDRKISPLKNLQIIGHGYDIPCFSFDRSKIPVLTASAGINGYELAEILRNEYRIEPEYASHGLMLAMTGAGDTAETLSALADALLEIDQSCTPHEPSSRQPIAELLSGTALVMPPERALESDGVFLPLSESKNRICAEYVWAYPPGVPLLIPGEMITSDIIDCLLCENAPELHSTGGRIPAYIKVTS